MRKYVKQGVVDSYLKQHPFASPTKVAKATGCHTGTVYLARKRLGIPSTISARKAATVEINKTEPVVSHVKEVPIQDVALQLHREEIARLQGNFALAKAAIFGLSAVLTAMVFALVSTFKQ